MMRQLEKMVKESFKYLDILDVLTDKKQEEVEAGQDEKKADKFKKTLLYLVQYLLDYLL